MDDDLRFAVAMTNLKMEGLMAGEGDELYMTDKGYSVAFEIWTKLSDEEKVLIGLFVRRNLKAVKE